MYSPALKSTWVWDIIIAWPQVYSDTLYVFPFILLIINVVFDSFSHLPHSLIFKINYPPPPLCLSCLSAAFHQAALHLHPHPIQSCQGVMISSPIVWIWLPRADLGSACKLAPQSPGLPQTKWLSMRVSWSILKLREVSSLSMGTIYSFQKRSSDQTYVNKHKQT